MRRNQKRSGWLSVGVTCLFAFSTIQGGEQPRFQKIRLTPYFWAEGIAAADFNRDGHMDIAYGPWIFWGPDFNRRTAYRAATNSFLLRLPDGTTRPLPGYEGALGTKNAYSDCFFLFTDDFNQDGRPDLLRIGIPGEPSSWYENPGRMGAPWSEHPAMDIPDNESPIYTDLTGDGRKELVCCSRGCIGFATPDWEHPYRPWTFHPITPKRGYFRYTHGLGVGDVNGDGRMDVLEKDGWWEQPKAGASHTPWTFHPYPFAPQGAAQIYAYDIDGDGDADVLTCLNPHRYGLAWYEQIRSNGQITFRKHLIMGARGEPSPCGVCFSQPHALTLADINGDGLLDLITGKRFWAHGPHGDVEPNAPAVLYWFELVRDPQGAHYVPHLVDDDSGVGTEVITADMDGDGDPDILTGNKKGAALFLNRIWHR